MIEPDKDELAEWIFQQHESELMEFLAARFPDTLKDIVASAATGEVVAESTSRTLSRLFMDDWQEQYDAYQDAEDAGNKGDEEWLPAASDFMKNRGAL